MIEISNEVENDYYIIIINGDVDASSSIFLDEAIEAAVEKGQKKIMVDGANLNYISSAGLGVFMSRIQEFEVNNINLVIFGLNEKVKNVFQILGLDQLIQITDSRSQAKELINEL
jgi:anti-sigma B factor antagonist